jgi:hypothetical protein
MFLKSGKKIKKSKKRKLKEKRGVNVRKLKTRNNLLRLLILLKNLTILVKKISFPKYN